MPRDLPPAILIARNLLENLDGWVWFIEIDRKSGGVYRLCDHPKWLLANGKKWLACQLSIELAEEAADGGAADISVTIPNIARIATGELEAGEIQGQEIRIWAELLSDKTTFRNRLTYTLSIKQAVANEASVTLTCGHALQLDRIPHRTFDATVAPVFGTTSGGAVR